MSVRGLRQNTLDSRSTLSATKTFIPRSSNSTVTWKRNPAWSTLPTVLSTDQKFVGLFPVWNTGSAYAIISASGNYTVDWGDGTVENFNSNATAIHLYNYSDTDLNNTDGPVTFTASTSTVNRTAHGYVDGDRVKFFNIVTTTGLTEGQFYYVINASTDTFQVSATNSGSAVTLTNDGSASLLPYKQAIVTLTPQIGQNLTALTLRFSGSLNSIGQSSSSTQWLEMSISGPNFTASGLTISSSANIMKHNMLEKVTILNLGNVNTCAYMFNECVALQSVSLPGTSNVTLFNSMFISCLSLQSVPLFDTSNGTTFASMFNNCYLLQSVPLFNTAAANDFSSMFNNCYLLQSVPLFNTVTGVTFTSMFSGCRSLQSIPLFNTANGTTFTSMFNNCYLLQSVPLFNTVTGVTFTSMFSGCSSLQSVPLFNTANGTTFTSMFSGCSSLQSVPLFNTVTGVTFTSMFSGCSSLQSVPLFNTANGTTFTSMFNSCSSLQSVPLFNTANGTAFGGMFNICSSFQSIPLFNTANGTAFSSMFSICSSLQSVPLLNTAKATTIQSMFSGCSSLQSVPLFNTANVTDFSTMFSGCVSLQAVSLFDTSKGNTFLSMFFGCNSLTTIPAMNFSLATATNVGFASTVQLSKISVTGITVSFSVASCRLSKTALEEIFANLAKPSSQQTITVSSNWGNDTAVSKTSCGTTSGSAVVTCSNTSSLTTGMLVTGTGISDAVAVTFQDTGDTVTRTAHGLANGTAVSFATIVSTTGIATYTTYYVVNAATDTFQVASVANGSALPLTTNGSGTMLYGSFIQSIVTNTSFTLSAPASATGTITATCRLLNSSIATLKNWAVTF
jgi:surface protein